jgi:hypothetical protein
MQTVVAVPEDGDWNLVQSGALLRHQPDPTPMLIFFFILMILFTKRKSAE